MHTVYLALGSNLGDRLGHLAFARAGLRSRAIKKKLLASSIYETEAVGGPSGQGRFLNQVVRMQTDDAPGALLKVTQALELERGRPTVGTRIQDGPRSLDVDLLLWDSEAIEESGLRIPHPRMHERRFVLAPLAELNPEVAIPVGGGMHSASELLRMLTP